MVRAEKAEELSDGNRRKKAATRKEDDYALQVLEDSGMRMKYLLGSLIS